MAELKVSVYKHPHHAHPLFLIPSPTNNECDLCRAKVYASYRCDPCNYDVCPECFAKAATVAAATVAVSASALGRSEFTPHTDFSFGSAESNPLPFALATAPKAESRPAADVPTWPTTTSPWSATQRRDPPSSGGRSSSGRKFALMFHPTNGRLLFEKLQHEKNTASAATVTIRPSPAVCHVLREEFESRVRAASKTEPVEKGNRNALDALAHEYGVPATIISEIVGHHSATTK